MEGISDGTLVNAYYHGEHYRHVVYNQTTFNNIIDALRVRYNIPHQDPISVTFKTPSGDVITVGSDPALHLIKATAVAFGLHSIDLTIVAPSTKKKTVPTHQPNHHMGDPFTVKDRRPTLADGWTNLIHGVGQIFPLGADQFKEDLGKFAAASGFDFILRTNCKYVKAICKRGMYRDVYDAELDLKAAVRQLKKVKKDGETEPRPTYRKKHDIGLHRGEQLCPWHVSGVTNDDNKTFIITEFESSHTCHDGLRKLKHKRISSKIIQSYIMEEITFNNNAKPRAIQENFRARFGFDISYKCALLAKYKALSLLYGTDDGSFSSLIWYKEALKETNHGSYYHVDIDDDTREFKRFFLAYEGSISGFQSCLPVLYVDGTFAHSDYKGQILAAVGRNGNNGMFPLAMCFCDSENTVNFTYFFKHLKNILDRQLHTITFVSNRGGGLLKAMDTIFPDSPHLFCYQHLLWNLKTRFYGLSGKVDLGKLVQAFFKVAYSSTKREYEHNLKDLLKEGDAGPVKQFLSEIPVQHWCRAFGPPNTYDIMASQMIETFNFWIKPERHMPIYQMLVQTRLKLMTMHSDWEIESASWTKKLTPEKELKLKLIMDRCHGFRATRSSEGVYDVRSEYAYTVNLNAHSCSCVTWEIECFPCVHACCAIQKDGKDVYEFIHRYFYADTFRKAYSFPINPVSDVDKPTFIPNETVTPPTNIKEHSGRKGRKALKRIKSAGETPKRQKINCTKCGNYGYHNRLCCPSANDAFR